MKHKFIFIGRFDGMHAGYRRLLQEYGATWEDCALWLVPCDDISLYGPQENARLAYELGVCEVHVLAPDCYSGDMPAELAATAGNCLKLTALEEPTKNGKPSESVKALVSYLVRAGIPVQWIPAEEQVHMTEKIIKYIEEGRLDQANKLLSTRYRLTGIVKPGRQLGRKMAFPTINQYFAPDTVLPAFGPYASFTLIDGRQYPSMTNVGVKPSVGEYDAGAETHIFDFSRDVYGKMIVVEFVERIRPEQVFDSIEALQAGIAKDSLNARRILEREPNCVKGYGIC